MPALAIVGIAAVAYGGIGLAMRAKFFPREKPIMALAWPLVAGIGRK